MFGVFMLDRKLFEALMLPISQERLESYRQDGDDDLGTLATYFWNMELSEALYPIIQAFEVALRNSVYTAVTTHCGTPDWFDLEGFLLEKQVKQVAEAKLGLLDRNKDCTPGRIIAELTFGFWVSMLNSPYEDVVWRANRAQALRIAFPHLPPSLRSRKKVAERVNRVLRLRNRVFHYEPIWKNRDLAGRVKEIIELLSMINPDLSAIITSSERFTEVHANGVKQTKEKLVRLMNLGEIAD